MFKLPKDATYALMESTELHMKKDERIAELERFAAKVNDIRNNIIGRQNVNWSMHIYPLVEALKEIGIEGDGYDIAREKAQRELDVLNAELAAAQATIAAKDAVLARVPKIINDDGTFDPINAEIDEALALPADRSCLDAMLKKYGKESADEGFVMGLRAAFTIACVQKDAKTQEAIKVVLATECADVHKAIADEIDVAAKTVSTAMLKEARKEGMLTGIDNCIRHVCAATNLSEAEDRLTHLRQAAGGE